MRTCSCTQFSGTSTIRGVRYSECLTPIEAAGALRLCTLTFSGQWAPGPGFLVLSVAAEAAAGEGGPIVVKPPV